MLIEGGWCGNSMIQYCRSSWWWWYCRSPVPAAPFLSPLYFSAFFFSRPALLASTYNNTEIQMHNPHANGPQGCESPNSLELAAVAMPAHPPPLPGRGAGLSFPKRARVALPFSCLSSSLPTPCALSFLSCLPPARTGRFPGVAVREGRPCLSLSSRYIMYIVVVGISRGIEFVPHK